MFNIDITHAPHLYAVGAAGLVILAALAILVLELRRVGSVPWPEWHDNRSAPRYWVSVRPLRSVRASGRITGTVPLSGRSGRSLSG